jgi:hypothetical protein
MPAANVVSKEEYEQMQNLHVKRIEQLEAQLRSSSAAKKV